MIRVLGFVDLDYICIKFLPLSALFILFLPPFITFRIVYLSNLSLTLPATSKEIFILRKIFFFVNANHALCYICYALLAFLIKPLFFAKYCSMERNWFPQIALQFYSLQCNYFLSIYNSCHRNNTNNDNEMFLQIVFHRYSFVAICDAMLIKLEVFNDGIRITTHCIIIKTHSIAKHYIHSCKAINSTTP